METTTATIRKKIENWIEQCDVNDVFTLTHEPFSVGQNCLCDEQKGFLSWGIPKSRFHSKAKNSERIFWFPNRIPNGRSLLIASSRIGNKPDTKPQIFDAIRTISTRLDRKNQFLISHESTSLHPYLKRASELFQIPIIEFRPFPVELDPDWFLEVLGSEKESVVYYDYQEFDGESDFQIDQFLIAVAREVRLLAVRKSGNIQSAATEKLQQLKNDGGVFVLVDSQLNPKRVTEDLVNRGAVPWYLYRQAVNETKRNDAAAAEPTGYIVPLDAFEKNHRLQDYLLHWTRRRKGPWPNQSNNRFLDDLILGTSSANHDRDQAILRILATNKLFASNDMTRDNTPVVCFSDTTVDRLKDLRKFRAHLARWDFETVGMAIKKTVLKSLGARAVIYGDKDEWSALEDHERPFFQKRQGNSTDWSIENEWRVPGNIDLAQIAVADAFVFIDDETCARRIACLSKWPIVVLGK